MPASSDLLLMPSGVRTLGSADNKLKIIAINNRLQGRLLKKVLVHEITHAWIFEYRYMLSVELEEFTCDFVASNAEDILQKADELLAACAYAVNNL